MPFKVKNLMIHVLPDAQGKNQPQPGLAMANACVCLGFFSWFKSEPPHRRPILGTGPNCGIPPIFQTPDTPIFHAPDIDTHLQTLATLRAQLQDALTQVEAQEKVLNEQLAPQTLEEAKALEGHLTDALAEVQRRIGELENKAGGRQG
jgi:hypothetical protein